MWQTIAGITLGMGAIVGIDYYLYTRGEKKDYSFGHFVSDQAFGAIHLESAVTYHNLDHHEKHTHNTPAGSFLEIQERASGKLIDLVRK